MQWVKHGRVFNPSVDRRPWYSTFGQAPATLILEDRVRVYFSAQPDAAVVALRPLGLALFPRFGNPSRNRKSLNLL